jgi:hypothetical protein
VSLGPPWSEAVQKATNCAQGVLPVLQYTRNHGLARERRDIRRPVRLPRRTIFSRCICRCSRVRPPPPTHTPPPHTGFPMSAHLSRLRLFQKHLRSLFWVWVWVWNWVHTPPHTLLHTLLFFSPPSFHTISLSLAFMMMMMSFIVLSETKPSLQLYTCLGSVFSTMDKR